jgi:hypothetical protein
MSSNEPADVAPIDGSMPEPVPAAKLTFAVSSRSRPSLGHRLIKVIARPQIARNCDQPPPVTWQAPLVGTEHLADALVDPLVLDFGQELVERQDEGRVNWTWRPVLAPFERSDAIGYAASRKNVNGETSIRPYRIGTSSGTRVSARSSRSSTGSDPVLGRGQGRRARTAWASDWMSP